MMSLVTTAHGIDPKALLSNGGGGGGNDSGDPLQTPRAIFPADFPSTAELMMPTAETIKRANPFDLSFGKANRIIGANRSILEQNGLVPSTSGTTSVEATATEAAAAAAAAAAATTAANNAAAAATNTFLAKLQLPSSLNHSPSIFSNIGLLGSATDGNENALKTADFALLVRQMKENGGLSTQNSFMDSGSSNAPKTADVLNAVLDIHMQSLANKSAQQQQQQAAAAAAAAVKSEGADAAAATAASINGYLNSSLFNITTPAGSAPNSAGVLASLAGPSAASIVNALASVAGGSGVGSSGHSLFVPPNQQQQQPSPGQHRQAQQQQPAVSAADHIKLSPKILFTDLNGMHPSTSSAVRPPSAPGLTTTAAGGTATATTTTTLMSALQQAQHKQAAMQQQQQIDPAAWDPHDVKPVVSGPNAVYEHDPMLGMHTGGYHHLDELGGGPRSNESGSSSTLAGGGGMMPHGHHGHPGRGGRGRSTAEMPPDERRQTILERNKAAAVRYRKRKKEEHDEMISRCQQMEHERTAILVYQTQNAVLRREVERLTAIVKEREMKCACLRGITLNSEMRERAPGDAEILEQLMAAGGAFGAGLQPQQAQQQLMNGLQHFGAAAAAKQQQQQQAQQQQQQRPPHMHKM